MSGRGNMSEQIVLHAGESVQIVVVHNQDARSTVDIDVNEDGLMGVAVDPYPGLPYDLIDRAEDGGTECQP